MESPYGYEPQPQPVPEQPSYPPDTGQTAPGTKPYTVLGQTYYPMLSGEGYYEEGIASWYGQDFHGKKTANGERYDMYGMTAAHKLLPFGTMVKVTSLENGNSIVVRINDRGPFVANRIIDLSHTGASRLDMLNQGTMRVRLETVGAVPGLKDGDLTGRFYIQIGAFGQEVNATALTRKIQGQSMGARSVYAPDIRLWRVQVGPYSDVKQAGAAADSLRATYKDCFIIAE